MRHVDEPFQISSTMEGRKVDDKLNTCFAKKKSPRPRERGIGTTFSSREKKLKKKKS